MKKLIVNIIIFFCRIMSYIIPFNKNQILFIYRGESGSNITPLLRSNSLKKYNLKIIRYEYKSSIRDKLLFYFELFYLTFKSKIVVTTHNFFRLRNDNYIINLWHGIPIKSMGLMNVSEKDRKYNFDFKNEIFTSSSQFYNTLMNSCIGANINNYRITGFPRNDYLFKSDGVNKIKNVLNLNVSKYNNILLYVPTFRDNKNFDRRSENISMVNNFDLKEFNLFLKNNNLLFVIKLHPNEESYFLDKIHHIKSSNIKLIEEDMLREKEIDLYECINAVDLLITDYSTIYFDYLLMNKPIIFLPTDYDEYRKTRGFLYEPYEYWTPGPKCYNQEKLIAEIKKSLCNKNYFENERIRIRNMMFNYLDGNSTKRVIGLILKIMNNIV